VDFRELNQEVSWIDLVHNRAHYDDGNDAVGSFRGNVLISQITVDCLRKFLHQRVGW